MENTLLNAIYKILKNEENVLIQKQDIEYTEDEIEFIFVVDILNNKDLMNRLSIIRAVCTRIEFKEDFPHEPININGMVSFMPEYIQPKILSTIKICFNTKSKLNTDDILTFLRMNGL